jgi:alkylation response protein AidB-like acyl-CoA dehydrogenase
VNLDLNEAQAAAGEAFTAFFDRQSPTSVVRDHESLGFSAALWERFRETGGPSLALPEAVGGGGAGLFEATLMAEAAGRCLAPIPFVEHLVVARLLDRCSSGAVTEAVEAASPFTLALRPARGLAQAVPAGAVARAVAALTSDGLVLAHGEAPGAAKPNGYGLPIADRDVSGGTRLAAGEAASIQFDQAVDEWRVLMAAALVGLCDAALALTVRYVTEREQFGVPIGTFQAIQHGLAELPGPLSGARLLVRRAAWQLDDGDVGRFSVDATMALHFAAELARTLTGRAIHFHGGYGVMAEYDIQLFYRRARGWPAQIGDPDVELERVADLLYGPAKVH